MRKRFWTGCLLVLACAGLASCGGHQAPPPPILRLDRAVQADLSQHPLKYRDYNLVFVSFDALQAAHVGCLGYHRNVTPVLDALAQRSCVFTRAQSVASWTVPASMTWFTGVYPTEHRMINKFAAYTDRERRQARLREVAPRITTLAEMFKQNGYATVGFTGNAGVSAAFGYDQGFDLYDHENGVFGDFHHSIPRAVAWLRQHSDRKFFMFLHGYDCHAQNSPHAGFDYRFVDPRYDGKYTGAPQEQEVLREEGLEHGRLAMRPEDVEFWRAIYDERIQRADARFGEFLAEIDRLGLREKTIFVLTSDHGTEYYEHGRFDHGFTLYQEQLHVPLFIVLPDQTASRIVDDLVSSIDLLPTVVDLLDLQLGDAARAQLRGTSLVAALRGEPVQRDLLSETDYREYTYKRAIVAPDGWKLIYTLESKTRELYDLNSDPSETENLAGREPARADLLQARLFEAYRKMGHDLTQGRWEPGLNPVYDSQAKEK